MKAYVNMSDYWVNERNKRALEDLVWRVMENEKGRPFDLHDFLMNEMPMLFAMVNLAIRTNDYQKLRYDIENHVRAYLEDSQWVEDRAIEMAQEE